MSGLERVIRAAFWNYLASLLNNIFGFVFWLFVFTLAGPEIVGYVVAITALSGTINAVISLGLDVGLVRYLGEAFGKGDLNSCVSYVSTAFTYRLCSGLGAFMVLITLALFNIRFGNYKPIHLLFAAILCLVGPIGRTFVQVLTATLQTRYYFYSVVVANIVKILILMLLVLPGYRLLAVMLAYISLSLCVTVLCFIFALRIVDIELLFNAKHFKQLVIAGTTQWVPLMLTLAVQNIGIIMLFSVKGAAMAGMFYVAYTIAGFIIGFASGVQSLMLPYLSGIEHGREKQAWHSLRLCLSMVLPIIVVIGIFSRDILSFLRPEYAGDWSILDLVLVTELISLCTKPVINLLYVRSMYRIILVIMLSSAIVKLMLYCLFVPLYGGLGLAFAYFVASVANLTLTMAVRHYVNYSIDASYIVRLAIVSFTLFIVTYVVHMFILSIVAMLFCIALGYFITLKMGLATRNDVVIIGRALVPQCVRQRINPYVNKLLNLIFS